MSTGSLVGCDGSSAPVSHFSHSHGCLNFENRELGVIMVPILMIRNGLNIITKSLSRVAKKASPNDIEGFTKKIMANITTTTDALVLILLSIFPFPSSSSFFVKSQKCWRELTIRAEAVQESDLVVEAIIESLKVKGDLFGFLDSKAK